MIKNREYFRSLSLNVLRDEIRNFRGERSLNEAYRDALVIFAFRLPDIPVPIEELVSIVGEPNVKEAFEEGQIWQYHWVGDYGPGKYRSCTPFVIRDGNAIRLAKWSETSFGEDSEK